MQSTNSEAQVTQTGQAIAINNLTCQQLIELFAPMLGPHGTLKALVSGGDALSLTKDGNALCKDVQFTHPTSVLITRAATSLYASTGDGTVRFTLLCCEIFSQAYAMYRDGTSIPLIINSLQLALSDALGFVQQSAIPLSTEALKALALSSLQTKIAHPEFLTEIVMGALVALSGSGNLDTDMVEVIGMEGGDIRDSLFVDGLVLDHSGRHHQMPTNMENVCVLAMNMSLEYEKPEVNAEFCYSSPSQRDAMAESEREFILARARAVADLGRELSKEGKRLLVVNEKGIDQYSLAELADAGVLGLRRAKRRNLERIVRMCGGQIVTQPSQVSREHLGFCNRVTVHDFGDNKYTFMEGTPMKGSCTILLRGEADYDRISKAIKGTLQSLALAVRSKCCIEGGLPFYGRLVRFLADRRDAVHSSDAPGYAILISAYENLAKALLRNASEDIHPGLVRMRRGELDVSHRVVDNVRVVANVLNSATVNAISLLMCDEIIKAGKPVKQDKIPNE